MNRPTALLVVGLLGALVGCGDEGEPLVDRDLPRRAQVQEVTERFQQAVRDADDELACSLMTESLRVSSTGERNQCSIDVAVFNPVAVRSIPSASIASLSFGRNRDQSADLLLSNGTRLKFRRQGADSDDDPSNADWRIATIGNAGVATEAEGSRAARHWASLTQPEKLAAASRFQRAAGTISGGGPLVTYVCRRLSDDLIVREVDRYYAKGGIDPVQVALANARPTAIARATPKSINIENPKVRLPDGCRATSKPPTPVELNP